MNLKQKKDKNLRIQKILPILIMIMAIGVSSYYLSSIFSVEAQTPLPEVTSPPLSCTGCHDFQAMLFTTQPHHHPNALTAPPGAVDMVTLITAIRQDCCACHNYLLNHTRGVILLKDPDPTDHNFYDGNPYFSNNLCLGCHDLPYQPPVFFSEFSKLPATVVNPISLSNEVREWRMVAHQWEFSEHNLRGLRCLDCHKHHGSSFKGMLKEPQPQLCYRIECHPGKAIEFDINNPSHHRIEGVLLNGMPTNVISCCDCHNPHHNTSPIRKPISDPYSSILIFEDMPARNSLPQSLYPVLPLPLVTKPVIGINGFPVTDYPYFINSVNGAGTPLANLFCLECHAPDIFLPANPAWVGAPNISYEINYKYYSPPTILTPGAPPVGTVSNFYYSHGHKIGGSCSSCHSNKSGAIPPGILLINGHFTHFKNASCTYCHDPHGTIGTFLNAAAPIPNLLNFPVPLPAIQRGHLLSPWLLTQGVKVLPYGGGYTEITGIGYTAASITQVAGANSCFANDPSNGCHSITRIHNPLKIKPLISCNTVPCHLKFAAGALRQGEQNDSLPPGQPQ